MELYKKHRPETLEQIFGQPHAVNMVKRLLDKDQFPHCILLTGPSGCGKTTIARILQKELKCGSADYQEIDCAVVEKPLETVRNVKRHMRMNPLSGPCRIFFLEEVQSLSRAGFSQQALLKLLEDAPAHAYFFLATTDPQKLHNAVRTRCTEIKLQPIDDSQIQDLISRVVRLEKMQVKDSVIDEIVSSAEGSARKALVILEQVGYLGSEKEQLNAISVTLVDKDKAIMLARELFKGQNANWSSIASLLRELENHDAEGLRRMVLGYARAILLKNGPRGIGVLAHIVIESFQRNVFDSGHAGLAAACFTVCYLQK